MDPISLVTDRTWLVMDPISLVMNRAPLVTRGLTVESTTVVMVSPSFLTTLLPVGTMRLMTIVTRFGGGTINSVKQPRGFKKPQLLRPEGSSEVVGLSVTYT